MNKQDWDRYTEAVNEGLRVQVDVFCNTYLSSGKRVGGNCWRVGGFQNEQGDTLVVWLSDGGSHRKGEWYHNALKQGGDALSLWMKVKGQDFKTGRDSAAQWVNCYHLRPGSDGSAKLQRVTAPRKAAANGKVFQPGKGLGEEWRYLVETMGIPQFQLNGREYLPIREGSKCGKYLMDRGLRMETLRRFGVGERDTLAYKDKGGVWQGFVDEAGKPLEGIICFPYWDLTGRHLLNVKYLAVDRVVNAKGKAEKLTKAIANAEYHLMGMQLFAQSECIVICEGEIDAMSAAQQGYAALSVPFGAKADGEDGKENIGNRWITNDWDYLASRKEITICFDNDADGIAAAETVFRRLP